MYEDPPESKAVRIRKHLLAEKFVFQTQGPKKMRLPLWLSGKESTCNAGDAGSIPGLVRSPGGEDGNPL